MRRFPRRLPLSSQTRKGVSFLPSERDRELLSSVSTHRWTNGFVSDACRRPSCTTCRVVHTVTRGWVGAPDERAPIRIHDAVVGFVYRCLSRRRNLAASNDISLSLLWPISAQHLARNLFWGGVEKLKAFVVRIGSQGER